MSLNHGAKCTTSNLVFAYDMGDKSSYVGPTMTNKTQYLNVTTSSGTGQSFIGGSEVTYVPSLGRTLVKTVKIQNDYPATSTNCCPAPVQHGNGITVSPSTVYTYLILYKIESGYTNANYMYRYEYTSNGGSYVTEQGVHSTSRRTHLGDNWYYAWGTFTTNASTNWLGFCGSFYYRYSTANDKFWVAKSAIIEGDWSGLHPKYWPAPNETRSNTQALLDWTGNYSINASNLTFNSDGSFKLNSSNPDYVDLGSDQVIKTTGGWTVESWVKFDTVPGGYDNVNSPGNFIGSDSIAYNSWYWSVFNNKLALWNRSPGTWRYGSTTLQANTWYQTVLVSDPNGTSYQMYLNGIAEGGDHTTYSWNASYSGLRVRYMGRGNSSNTRRINGYLPVTKIYNRALTAKEVYKNFQALRGRYGI